jgi:hypothetical protein
MSSFPSTIRRPKIPIQPERGSLVVLSLFLLLLSWQHSHLLPSVTCFSVLTPPSSSYGRTITSRMNSHQGHDVVLMWNGCGRQWRRDLRGPSPPLALMMASSLKEDDVIEGAANQEMMSDVRELFSKNCDDSGLMTKATLESLPPFATLLVGPMWVAVYIAHALAACLTACLTVTSRRMMVYTHTAEEDQILL